MSNAFVMTTIFVHINTPCITRGHTTLNGISHNVINVGMPLKYAHKSSTFSHVSHFFLQNFIFELYIFKMKNHDVPFFFVEK